MESDQREGGRENGGHARRPRGGGRKREYLPWGANVEGSRRLTRKHPWQHRTMTAEKTPLLVTIDVAGGVVRGNSEMTLLSRQITKDIKETLSK